MAAGETRSPLYSVTPQVVLRPKEGARLTEASSNGEQRTELEPKTNETKTNIYKL